MPKSNTTEALHTKADILIEKREEIENGVLRQGHDALYALLAECYELATAVRSDRQMQKDLNAVLSERQIQIGSDTPIETKITKLVFGANRKVAYTYSIPLRVARSEGIAISDLPEWIRQSGGIEELRLSPRTSSEDAKAKRQEKLDAAENAVKALRDLTTINKNSQTPDKVGPVVLIGEVLDDGTVKVKAMSAREGLVNQALLIFEKELSERRETPAAKQERDRAETIARAAEESLEQAAA